MPISSRLCYADQVAHPGGRVNEHARDQMLPLVYDELRRLAAQKMAAWSRRTTRCRPPRSSTRPGCGWWTPSTGSDWDSRGHFFAAAAEAMRRILIDSARRRQSDKRGGEAERVSLSLVDAIGETPSVDLIALHDALVSLAAIDARKSRVVELKFFGGLTIAEIAGVMELSPATIEREWSFSRAWLYDALAGGGP